MNYKAKIKSNVNTAALKSFAQSLRKQANGPVMINGKEVDINSLEVEGVELDDYPDFSDAFASAASFVDGTPLSDQELEELDNMHPELIHAAAHERLR